MSRHAFGISAVLLMLLLPATARAAEADLPAGAKQAEKAKHWDEALRIYDKALAEHPERYDWWVHVSDIYAVSNQPAKAADAAAHAVHDRPDDIKLLLKHAQLAAWAGDSAAAEQSYRALVRLNPGDDDSLYALGETISWQGKTGQAIPVIETYVTHRPTDKKALMFLSQLYMWDGQGKKSEEALNRYRAVAGDDAASKAARVHLLANSGQDYTAIAAANEELRLLPNDCDLYSSRASAAASSRQPGLLFDSLQHAGDTCTDKTAASNTARQLSTPYRSFVRGQFGYSTDSDTVQIGTATLDGVLQVDPGTYLFAGVERGWLDADLGTGFETLAGHSRVDLTGGWAGAEKQMSDRLWLKGRVGYRDASEGGGAPLLKADAEYRPTDTLVLGFDANHDLFAVSPRTVSKDIEMTNNVLRATWRMGYSDTLNLEGGYTFLTDGNGYWTATVAPRHTLLSGQKLSIDVGASGQWTSFTKDLNNGYYDPNSYRQFLVSLFGSYAFNADNAINVALSPGVVRDEAQAHYERAGDYSVEGTFGLYKDWMLDARADFFQSLGQSKDYHRNEYTAGITRRF